MKIKERKIVELLGADYNPRTLSEAEYKQIEASMKQFGCQACNCKHARRS